MADPLSIGASVVAFIGLADQIIRACQYCIETIEDAPKDIRMILGEVSSLQAILDSTKGSDPHSSSVSTLVRGLFGERGPIEACYRCLSELEALLPAKAYQRQGGNRHRITIADLSWTLKKSKARKLLAEISHHKATLLLAISGDIR